MNSSVHMRRQLIQLLFWGAWIGLYVLASTYSTELYSGVAMISILLGLGCWIGSEVLRAQILRGKWLDLPAPQLLLRLLGSLTLVGIGVQLLIFLILVPSHSFGLVALPGEGPDYRPTMVVVYWLNSVFMVGVWVTLWLFIESRNRSRKLQQRRLEDESRRRLLELDSLRSRLNPHFVFNALNNLRALINEDTERARQLVTLLSNTLRYALYHSQEDDVSLQQELAVVEDYLAIEQIHYEGRLHLVRHITSEATLARLPPMLLQLLVENAIKHGIARVPGGGVLEIAAELEGDSLVLQVTNPGSLSSDRCGVGLAYLRARLEAWPRKTTFALEENAQCVVARISLPQKETP